MAAFQPQRKVNGTWTDMPLNATRLNNKTEGELNVNSANKDGNGNIISSSYAPKSHYHSVMYSGDNQVNLAWGADADILKVYSFGHMNIEADGRSGGSSIDMNEGFVQITSSDGLQLKDTSNYIQFTNGTSYVSVPLNKSGVLALKSDLDGFAPIAHTHESIQSTGLAKVTAEAVNYEEDWELSKSKTELTLDSMLANKTNGVMFTSSLDYYYRDTPQDPWEYSWSEMFLRLQKIYGFYELYSEYLGFRIQSEWSDIQLLTSGGNMALQGGDIRFDTYFTTITLDEIVNRLNYTCFRGDTSYVTMADGSKKLISEIKMGDRLKSIDIETDEECENLVIACINTGIETNYTTMFFENGATVDIYGKEYFVGNVPYTVDDKDEKHYAANYDKHIILSNDVINKFYKEGHNGRTIVTESGDTKFLQSSNYIIEEPTKRYTLVTSNGVFYVNGVLTAHRPQLLQKYINIAKNVPDDVKSISRQASAIVAKSDNKLPDDNFGNEECRRLLKQKQDAIAIIAENKNYLSATDYKKAKYDEGELPEEEWLIVKELRSQARQRINEQEAIRDEAKKVLETKYPEVSKEDWIVRNDNFRTAIKLLSDNIDIFDSWVNSEIERRKPKRKEPYHRNGEKADEKV